MTKIRLILSKRYCVVESPIPFTLVANDGTDSVSRSAGAWRINCAELLPRQYFPLYPVFNMDIYYDETLLKEGQQVLISYSDIDLGEGIAGVNGQLVTVANNGNNPLSSVILNDCISPVICSSVGGHSYPLSIAFMEKQDLLVPFADFVSYCDLSFPPVPETPGVGKSRMYNCKDSWLLTKSGTADATGMGLTTVECFSYRSADAVVPQAILFGAVPLDNNPPSGYGPFTPDLDVKYSMVGRLPVFLVEKTFEIS